jgi:hypothetical protein
MANEDAQGIDDLLDDIDETPETEQPEATQETDTPAETQPETPVATETEAQTPETESLEETESQVAKLFPQKEVDHSGQTVPLDKHTALRKRAQIAEARAAELEAQTANAPQVGDVLSELGSLVDGEDDEYVDKQTLKQTLQKLPDAIQHVAQQTVQTTLSKAATQNMNAKAQSDEAAFKKEHADYDQVTGYVFARNLLTDQDRQKLASSSNIAQTYYEISQEKIAAERQILGVAPSQPQTTTTEQPTGQPAPVTAEAGDDAPLDDDSGFDGFMSRGIGS